MFILFMAENPIVYEGKISVLIKVQLMNLWLWLIGDLPNKSINFYLKKFIFEFAQIVCEIFVINAFWLSFFNVAEKLL